MPQLSILVVDDDQEVRDFLQDFLEGEGYAVSLLSDPTEAVASLKANQYHLIILDLMMPELSGIDLLSQIRQIDDDVAIIILTGHPSLETATTSIELEVSAYIRKPFDPHRENRKEKGPSSLSRGRAPLDHWSHDSRVAKGTQSDPKADVEAHGSERLSALSNRARGIVRISLFALQSRHCSRREHH